MLCEMIDIVTFSWSSGVGVAVVDLWSRDRGSVLTSDGHIAVVQSRVLH